VGSGGAGPILGAGRGRCSLEVAARGGVWSAEGGDAQVREEVGVCVVLGEVVAGPGGSQSSLAAAARPSRQNRISLPVASALRCYVLRMVHVRGGGGDDW
jgi:hypothetical protein